MLARAEAMGEAFGVLAAVAAGASFAGGGVLQQRVAARSERQGSAARLVAGLARKPAWLAGIAMAAASNALEALALAFAPLAVVQPLLVTELVFAVPVSARLVGVRLGAREWAGLAGVSVGLAAAVWGAAATGGGGVGSAPRWLAAGGVVALAAVCLAAIGRTRSALVRASCDAAGAALVFAVSSALLAATVHGFATAGLGGFTRPAPYAMAVASIVGLLLIQSAYQAGPLAVAMPMVDWVGPLVAVVLGVSVLGESIDTSPAHLAALAAGAVVALAGMLSLDASPRVRVMLWQQRRAATDVRPPSAGAPAGKESPLPVPTALRAVGPVTSVDVGGQSSRASRP
jgi:drug/metabolite transporter (DMT)-like permease